MEKDYYSTVSLLTRRIEQNYEDFKRETLQLDGESIFELAPTIAAVQDAYFYMTTHNLTDDYETEYLLSFENPLILLADKWEDYSENRSKDFGDMFNGFIRNCRKDYLTSSINEMIEEYGADTLLEVMNVWRIAENFKTLLSIWEVDD